jgi:hypothetical protein
VTAINVSDGRLSSTPNLATGTVTALIGEGVTEVTFTNADTPPPSPPPPPPPPPPPATPELDSVVLFGVGALGLLGYGVLSRRRSTL